MKATQQFCKSCKTWHPKGEGCPTCGYAPGFNKALMTGMLNSHLFGQADRVTTEKTDQAHFVREAKKEHKRVTGS